MISADGIGVWRRSWTSFCERAFLGSGKMANGSIAWRILEPAFPTDWPIAERCTMAVVSADITNAGDLAAQTFQLLFFPNRLPVREGDENGRWPIVRR